MVGADQAEVAWVLGLEEVGLLVLSWSLLARGVSCSPVQLFTHKAASQLLWQSSRRHWALRSLGHVGGSCRLLRVRYAFGRVVGGVWNERNTDAQVLRVFRM